MQEQLPELDATNLVKELLYCLEQGFPAHITHAMLHLSVTSDWREKKTALRLAYAAWDSHDDDSEFTQAVESVTGSDCSACEDCGLMFWNDEMTWVGDEKVVCDDNCLGEYASCDDCDTWVASDDTTTVYNDRGSVRTVCDTNCLSNYTVCDRCSDRFESTTTVQDRGEYCQSCLENYCTWCEECDEYYNDNDDHGHNDDEDDEDDEGICSCEAPIQRFYFPANGAGLVSQDERLTVELPAGTISEEGIYLIVQKVQQSFRYDAFGNNHDDAYFKNFVAIAKAVNDVGPLWQAKRGNFTRRLQSALFKKGIKPSEETISAVGNLARQHSTDAAVWYVEFTRNLNQSASNFFHSGSCWFSGGSYGRSRCRLKQWGGLAIRSYSHDEHYSGHSGVTGRAWIQPLTDQMYPTHNTEGAHAYVVYNGYGTMEGYVSARIVAHLTGRSYKKILFEADGQYINAGGYLVADEKTCLDTTGVEIGSGLDRHDQIDAHNFHPQRSAVA